MNNSNKENNNYINYTNYIEKDIVIIGAGAAGMCAALNAARGGKSVVIIEKNSFGGQIAYSPKVENFPSIESISGMDFSTNLFTQIINWGVQFELETVLSVEKENDLFITTTDYNKYLSKVVIIATGVSHRKLNLEHEDELVGKGISYCAICDGAFFEGKEVAVIGDANTALQYALMLSNTSPKVYLCTLFDKFFGEKIYEERIKSKENIEVIQNISLQKYLYDDNLKGLVFKNTKTNEEFELKVEGVFIAIGQIPHNEIFSNLVDLDKNGYIITNENMETKTEGLYAIGDCRVKKIRQLTTAVADGSIVSFNAINYIESK